MIDAWLTGNDHAPIASAPQYLSFWLGEQCFALPVTEVQEIRAMGAWSTLPGSPAWVLGIMNLRGLVIPLIDLRLRFGIEPARAEAHSAVMIVVSAGGKLGALVVDGVRDVSDIAPESLRPAAGETGSAEARCVAAVATLEEEVVIVLDPMAVLFGHLADPAQPAPRPDSFHAETRTPRQDEEEQYAGLVR